MAFEPLLINLIIPNLIKLDFVPRARGAPFIQAARPDEPFKAKYAERGDFVGREATPTGI